MSVVETTGELLSERRDVWALVAAPLFGKGTAHWPLNEAVASRPRDHYIEKHWPSVFTGTDFADCKLPPAHIAELVELIENGTISSKIAKEVFDHVWNGEGSPSEVVEMHGLKQVTDTGAIEKAVDEIIAANPDKAAAVAEKPQAIGWFVGQVMKATGGKANPAAVNEILKAKLGV